MMTSMAGEFTVTGPLHEARFSHSDVVLAGLGALVIAGVGQQGTSAASGLVSGVEFYDQTSGQWSMRAALPVARDTCGAALLRTGHVLVAGGSQAGISLDDSQLYEVASDRWASTGRLNTPRFSHTTTVLQSADVLVVGGNNLQAAGGQVLDSVELYDSLTGRWHRQSWLPVDCMNHTATLLASANVLVVGGYSGRQNVALARAFSYDASTGQWTEVSPPPVPLMQHTATLLQDGRVLVAGGASEAFGAAHKAAFIYNPTADSWERADMNIPRKGHSATRLATGEILVVGASAISDPGNAQTAEFYDPQSGRWTLTSPLQHGRFGHTASCLSTGQVLIAGGARPVSHPAPIMSAELFTRSLSASDAD